MKIKTSKSALERSFKTIYAFGYCELQYELQGINPDYYVVGKYGWDADVYKLNNTTILVTGDRPFGKDPNRQEKKEVCAMINNLKKNR